jgi:alcohol dehydrogenase (NADP+)
MPSTVSLCAPCGIGVGPPLIFPADGVLAQGGYSSSIRVHDRWVFTIPEAIKSEDAAPMLCAGLTVYSPLLRNGAGPGKTVGIVGIGGLGRELRTV